jgi:hypothetical protein
MYIYIVWVATNAVYPLVISYSLLWGRWPSYSLVSYCVLKLSIAILNYHREHIMEYAMGFIAISKIGLCLKREP